jgi:hypothetical protein
MDGVMCAISVEEWNIIHELYGGGPFIECSTEESEDTPGKDKLWSNIPLCADCRKSRYVLQSFAICTLIILFRLSNFNNVDINVYRLAEGERLPWAANNPTPSTPPKAKPKAVNLSDVIHIDDTDIESPTLSDDSPPARAPGNRKRQKPTGPITYGPRKSKRLRTVVAKWGNTFSISVSKDDTVRDIKRKVFIWDIVDSFRLKIINKTPATD